MRIIFTLTACVLLTAAEYLPVTDKKALTTLKDQIKVVYELLERDCPQATLKQEISKDNLTHLEVQKQLYEQLMEKLIECIQKNTLESTTLPLPKETNSINTNTSADVPIKTTRHTTPTTTTHTTTTLPRECKTAINYTQSWRKDHKGSNIKPGGHNSRSGYACDLHKTDSQWFRFSGAAGDKMLNTCPKWLSCGAYYPIWTDEKMPQVVGVESRVPVYGVFRVDCKRYTYQVKVIRCSWDTPHDLIYKQTKDYSLNCNDAFCGMS